MRFDTLIITIEDGRNDIFLLFLAINNLDPKLLKYVDTKANASPDQNFF